MVERRDLVEDLGVVDQRLEAVRHALGDEEHTAVVRGELDGDPAMTRGRVGAQVERHVVDSPARAAYQLGLLMRRRLEVQAAHGAARGVPRHTALRQCCGQAARLELARAPRAREEAARVAETLGLDEPHAAQRGLAEDHARTMRGAGTGTMNAPPRRRYASCCSMISSAMFQGSSSVKSGIASRSASGARIGRRTPGISRPCLCGLRSTVNSSRSGPTPQALSSTVPLAGAP